MKCKFDPAWTVCNKEAEKNKSYCKEHLGIKCGSCGKQANRQCSATYSLVCGFPMCENCVEHNSKTRHWHGPK